MWKKLRLAFGDCKGWTHRILEPGKESGLWEVVDGFRVGEAGNQTITYKPAGQSPTGWWKIENFQTAIVDNGPAGTLEFKVVSSLRDPKDHPPQKKTDEDFGWKDGN